MKSEILKYSNKNHELYLLAISLILIVIFAISPIFKNFSNIYTKDDYLISLSYEYYSIKSIFEYHEFPLWSPFFNGGYPIISHPEASAATPWILLFLSFGEVEGIKFSMVISVIVGAIGMLYLTKRVLKFNNIGSLFSSLVFIFCGFNITILTEYWSQIIYSYYLIPLILGTFIKSGENKKYLIITSLLMLPVLLRGALSFIIVCLLLFLFAALDIVSRHNGKINFNFTPIKNLILILFLTSLMGMLKILPMLQLLRINTRAIDNYAVLASYCLDIKTLFALLVNSGDMLHSAIRLYFGYIPVLLCVLTLIFYFKEIWKYGFILFIFIILTLGKNSPIDFLYLLWKLPLFHSLMDITEYSFPIISFLVSLLSGKFFQIIDEKKKLRALKLVLILTAFISLTQLFLIYNSSFKNLFDFKRPESKNNHNFYQVRIAPKDDYNKRAFLQYSNLINNIGTINWNSDIPLPTNVQPKFIQNATDSSKLILNPSYKGEAYFLKGDNKTSIAKVTSNIITVNVDVKTPDKLILNQNAFPGWRCNSGFVKNYNGLLSVDIFNKGKSIVVFKFMPRSFYIGSYISLISFILSVLYLLYVKTISGIYKS